MTEIQNAPELKEKVLASSFKNDMRFLINLGDSEIGFVIRGEVAEMNSVPLGETDALILGEIYGDDD